MTRIVGASAALAAALMVSVIAAPVKPKLLLRTVEPRLSGAWQWHSCSKPDAGDGRLIDDVVCGSNLSPPPVSMVPAEDCDDVIRTQSEAVEALAEAPQCTDAAVTALSRMARTQPQPSVLSDLAAAYFVRAQRKNRPSDLVRSLDAADDAVKRAPGLTTARFNQALAFEALGFEDDAILSWEELRRFDAGTWGREASEHWQRLTKARAVRAATRWPLNRERLANAVRLHDGAAVLQLVSPYRATALQELTRIILPAWAKAVSVGDRGEARRRIGEARTLASALARLTHDRYLLDVVEQIRSANAARRHRLAKGVLVFAEAKDRQTTDLVRSGELFRKAATILAGAGSPLSRGATIGVATAALQDPAGPDRGIALLASVGRQERGKGYGNLLGSIHTTRGLLRLRQSRYLDALAEYDAAQAIYARMHDGESLASIHARKLGILRVVGQNDLAWREAQQATRYLPNVVNAVQQHYLFGEEAVAAVALGYPDVALRYQDAAVRLLEDQLAAVGENQGLIKGLRVNLGIALRERAAIRGRLNDARAKDDLAQAERLMADMKIEENGQRARMFDVKARLLLHTTPKLAADAFTEAYGLALAAYYRSYAASLLVGRAEAHLLSGDRAAAEADLKQSIADLRHEERGMMAARDRGQGELLWSAYFSRSRDAYTRLIRQLTEEGSTREAYRYAEQARAYEVLSLVLELEDVPSSFRSWTKQGEPLDLPHIQQALPPGTFLVEYSVLGDRTAAWVVGHSDFETFSLPVAEEQIAAWTADLERSASRRREGQFRATLAAVSAALVRRPLERIAEIARVRNVRPRVIFVPDGPMHGLPFPAMHDPAGGGRPLIERYPVATAPSATIYAFSLVRDAKLPVAKRPDVLLVGDPAFDRHLAVAQDLPPLKRAEAEVKRIREIYRKGARVVRLLRKKATVPAFLELARRSTIVHFAGHAVINPDEPSRSLLLFAPSHGHSGALDAQELLTKLQSAQARLVVLSACSTAGGVPVGSEGLAPLMRPILAAGIPAAVGSLWSVRDDETEELFAHFHEYYRRGQDADVALQHAQLDMLHHRKQLFRSPAVWASFQVIGYASSPFPAAGAQKRRK